MSTNVRASGVLLISLFTMGIVFSYMIVSMILFSKERFVSTYAMPNGDILALDVLPDYTHINYVVRDSNGNSNNDNNSPALVDPPSANLNPPSSDGIIYTNLDLN